MAVAHMGFNFIQNPDHILLEKPDIAHGASTEFLTAHLRNISVQYMPPWEHLFVPHFSILCDVCVRRRSNLNVGTTCGQWDRMATWYTKNSAQRWSPSQRPMARSFDVFFYMALTNGWANNLDADDLGRHRAHYDVTVMIANFTGSTVSVVGQASTAGLVYVQIPHIYVYRS